DQAPADHFGQRLGALLILLVDGIRVHPRSHVAAVVRALLVEHHQLLGRFHRQLAQQDLIDQREDGGVGADAQREREDGDNREQRAAKQPTDCKSEVVERKGHLRRLDVTRGATVDIADCGLRIADFIEDWGEAANPNPPIPNQSAIRNPQSAMSGSTELISSWRGRLPRPSGTARNGTARSRAAVPDRCARRTPSAHPRRQAPGRPRNTASPWRAGTPYRSRPSASSAASGRCNVWSRSPRWS